ncbi:MAG: DedA family protein [Chloroflexi bacterium]|nr:DedA family protein [Chloroflexota bacterium]
MSDIATALLAWLVVYSYPVVGLTVLIAAIGFPVPSTVIVLAAGALSAEGDPEPFILFGVVLAAAVTGDLTSYTISRRGGEAIVRRYGPRVGLPPERVAAFERRFERWGGLLVVATRCLLTGLALPTNLVAGASGYPAWHFLGASVLGESLWAGGLVSLGWWYGANWVGLLDYLNDTFTAVSALVLAGILLYALTRLVRARTPASRIGS